MECFNDTFGFYPSDEYTDYKRERYEQEFGQRIYRVSYPEHFYIPTSRFEKASSNVSIWKSMRYTPYKRISHFREHINRLQYCQSVTIPPNVLASVKRLFQEELNHTDSTIKYCYLKVKQHLRQQRWSHLNEHIHYLISQNTDRFICISYDDHRLMCTLFTQLEHAFKQTQRSKTHDRKNIFSYYLIVQLILYLFHYHPHYHLPTLYDHHKRHLYYEYLLTLIQKVPVFEQIMFIHFKRKRDCQACQQQQVYFDEDLTHFI